MSTNVDKATKLMVKLGLVEEKITNFEQERDEIVAEIQSILTGSSQRTTGPVAGISGHKKGKKGALGEKILEFMVANPTVTNVSTIAKGLRVMPNAVALSLFHLKNKGRAFQQGDNYYPAVPAMAAKIAPPTLDQRLESGS